MKRGHSPEGVAVGIVLVLLVSFFAAIVTGWPV